MEDEVVLNVRDIWKSYGERTILKGTSLHVNRQEIVVIIGGSGSGKSTLLRHLLGVEAPDRGTVELLGHDLRALGEDALRKLRRRFGILFQSGALFGSMTVGENVALPLEEHTRLNQEMRDIVVRMKLDLVGLADCVDLMPGELSGGMKKRAGLARAIALDPELMFYDEPQSGLDPVLTAVIDDLILALNAHLHMTGIVVTHHMESAMRLADRIYMLHRGEIIAEGTPEAIKASDDPRVRQFVFGLVEGPLTEGEPAHSIAAEMGGATHAGVNGGLSR